MFKNFATFVAIFFLSHGAIKDLFAGGVRPDVVEDSYVGGLNQQEQSQNTSFDEVIIENFREEEVHSEDDESDDCSDFNVSDEKQEVLLELIEYSLADDLSDPLESIYDYSLGNSFLCIDRIGIFAVLFDKIKKNKLRSFIIPEYYIKNAKLNKDSTILELFNYNAKLCLNKSHSQVIGFAKNLRHNPNHFDRCSEYFNVFDVISEKILLEEIKKMIQEMNSGVKLNRILSDSFYQLSQIYSHILDGCSIEAFEDRSHAGLLHFSSKKKTSIDIKKILFLKARSLLCSLFLNKNNEMAMIRMLELYAYDASHNPLVRDVFADSDSFIFLSFHADEYSEFLYRQYEKLVKIYQEIGIDYKWEGPGIPKYMRKFRPVLKRVKVVKKKAIAVQDDRVERPLSIEKSLTIERPVKLLQKKAASKLPAVQDTKHSDVLDVEPQFTSTSTSSSSSASSGNPEIGTSQPKGGPAKNVEMSYFAPEYSPTSSSTYSMVDVWVDAWNPYFRVWVSCSTDAAIWVEHAECYVVFPRYGVDFVLSWDYGYRSLVLVPYIGQKIYYDRTQLSWVVIL
jgi:hypothetical protein